MPTPTVSISIESLSDRDKEQAAADLIRAIHASDSTATVSRQPAHGNAMDFGATLVLVLGSGAAIAIAKGIQNWMGRWHSASLKLIDGTRKIEVRHVSRAELAEMESLINSFFNK